MSKHTQGKLKVKVSNVDERDLKELAEYTNKRIKEYVTKNPKSNLKTMKRELKLTDKFFEFKHVCMNCGDVQKMSSYPIAQTTMGHKVNYTCDCGHVTELPQN